jgi:hypothetical protein
MSDKLELKDILGALDCGAKEVWDEITADQKKQVSFFLLNRYMSSVRSTNREMQEHFILTVNEYFNKNFFNLSKHPKLLWQLLAMCSHESKKIMYHEWIGFKKKVGNNKRTKFLLEIYPNKKEDEIEMMDAMMTDKEFKDLCRTHGMEESVIAKKLK